MPPQSAPRGSAPFKRPDGCGALPSNPVSQALKISTEHKTTPHHLCIDDLELFFHALVPQDGIVQGLQSPPRLGHGHGAQARSVRPEALGQVLNIGDSPVERPSGVLLAEEAAEGHAREIDGCDEVAEQCTCSELSDHEDCMLKR